MPILLRSYGDGQLAREISFGFERCHATQACGGDRLAESIVGHVAGGVTPWTLVAVESGAVQR
jgi:hypothetical protein